jgi:hypothetical protein
MPAVSGKQYRLMLAAAHGKSNKVPRNVAREFIEHTPKEKRKKWMRRFK